MTFKAGIRRFLRNIGWEVQRLENANVEAQVIQDLLDLSGARIALDVGANVGQWGDAVLDAGFDGLLISFEALPQVHSVLAEHAARRSANWIVAPCAALGSERGNLCINVSANTASSSVLPMHDMHLEAAPESAYVASQPVRVERLDALASTLIPRHGDIYLKIDTQGYEREVIKGSTGLFDRLVAIQVELSLIPLYEGAPTFTEMIALIESQGFELFSIVPGFKDKRVGRLLQVDGFFVRNGSIKAKCNPT